jgi:hypothetical protein
MCQKPDREGGQVNIKVISQGAEFLSKLKSPAVALPYGRASDTHFPE